MAQQFSAGRFKSWLDSGLPNAGGRLYTYVSGTTTFKAAYKDATLGTPCTYTSDGQGGQYIALNARGEAQVWVGTGTYTFADTTPLGVSIDPVDGIYDPQPLATAALSAATAAFSAANGSTLVGFQAAGSGAVARTSQDKLREFIHATDFSGYDATGVADSTAAILLADSAARSAGKALRISGTPRIKTTITLTVKTHWIFEGSIGVASGNLPPSYIIKDATLAGPCLVIGSGCDGVKFEGGGIVGETGNTGDGLVVKGNSFSWVGAPYFYQMGQDGVRVGADASGPSNANSFYFEMPVACGNGRHGMNIDDKPATAPDANAGLITRPFLHHNAFAGLRYGNANLGNVCLAPVIENNGTGLLFDTLSNRNLILGGDIEQNTVNLSVLSTVGNYGNQLVNVTIAGGITNTDRQNTSFLPVLYGGTTAGTGTYTSQKGNISIVGGVCTFGVELSWTAHTGTGLLLMDLPQFKGAGTNIASQLAQTPTVPPSAFIVNVVPSGVTLTAGNILSANVSTSAGPPRVGFSQMPTGGGVPGNLLVPASGTLFISGSFPIFLM